MKHFFAVILSLLSFPLLAQPAFVVVLGVAQDAGYPQMGCEAKCCNLALQNDSLKRKVVSLALVDPASKKWWLFEATPDIKEQLQQFKTLSGGFYPFLPAGIFLTHAHIGHYTGLMQLGREVMNTKDVPVYVLPKMKNYLETNGPWSQLVSQKNILITRMAPDSSLKLSDNISIQAFKVPHRDEFSETAGFKISADLKKYLFIPDIDKWDKWEKKITEQVALVDFAFIDATFYEATELKNRKISEVPHPLVTETIQLFSKENMPLRNKIIFIHFNHTNPLMWDKITKEIVKGMGFGVADEGERY